MVSLVSECSKLGILVEYNIQLTTHSRTHHHHPKFLFCGIYLIVC